jgi:hypothetical protein
MNFEGVEKIAAAILYEGYILYPYRATAIKNRQRWNFGTLYPRIYAEAQRPEEPFRLIAECLVVADGEPILDIRLSFLQLMRQKEAEDKLTDPSLAWDEAVERASEHSLQLKDLLTSPLSLSVKMETAGGRPHNPTQAKTGLEWATPALVADEETQENFSSRPVESWACGPPKVTKNILRTATTLHGRVPLPFVIPSEAEGSAVPRTIPGNVFSTELQIDLTIGAQMLEDGACKLRIEVQNITPLPSGVDAKREEALPSSLVSAHLVLGITNGEFVSLLDPAEAYRASAAACSNTGVFPVLAGKEPDRSMMLCSPIILYDYPKIAPESAGDFFDSTEMDEMLTLRVLTLTDAEKEEMRSGDPRARRILERTESLTGDAMLKAHGVIRGLREIRGDAS